MNKKKESLYDTIREIIGSILEDSKEEIVKTVEKKVEEHFSNRIEQLETRVEKNVEEFLLKNFDSMGGIKKSEGAQSEENLKNMLHEILDVQEEMVRKMEETYKNELEKIKNKVNNIENEIEVLKKAGGSSGNFPVNLKELEEKWEERFFEVNKRLEETKKLLLDEITRVENKRLPPLPPPPQPLEEFKSDVLKRIERVENEIFDLKQKIKEKSSAVIVE